MSAAPHTPPRGPDIPLGSDRDPAIDPAPLPAHRGSSKLRGKKDMIL
jgi:hypothetical protein